MLIITNNKKFIGYMSIKDNIIVEYKEEAYLQVLFRARDYIHKNYKLLTHPLYGNITPTSTVYRTLVLEEGKELDLYSVSIIGSAIEKVERIISTEKTKKLTESIRKDLEFIDFALIEETLNQIL